MATQGMTVGISATGTAVVAGVGLAIWPTPVGEGSDIVPPVMEMSKQSKRSQKERATDTPSWVDNYPQIPGENCGDYAKRILAEKYGCNHPRATERGADSEYSKIKKNCERG